MDVDTTMCARQNFQVIVLFQFKVVENLFWISFDQKKQLANQTVVTFHPLFIARNHLSQDIRIQFGNEATINLPAKGQETQVSIVLSYKNFKTSML